MSLTRFTLDIRPGVLAVVTPEGERVEVIYGPTKEEQDGRLILAKHMAERFLREPRRPIA